MTQSLLNELSRRERQIMDAVYRRGSATAVEVSQGMPNPPSNAAVRAMLGILVRKGVLKIEKDGPRYVYRPASPRRQAGRSAIRRVVETFFENSVEDAVAAVLDTASVKLTASEIARLKSIIDKS